MIALAATPNHQDQGQEYKVKQAKCISKLNLGTTVGGIITRYTYDKERLITQPEDHPAKKITRPRRSLGQKITQLEDHSVTRRSPGQQEDHPARGSPGQEITQLQDNPVSEDAIEGSF